MTRPRSPRPSFLPAILVGIAMVGFAPPISAASAASAASGANKGKAPPSPTTTTAPTTPGTPEAAVQQTLAVLPLTADGLLLNEANRLNLLLRARATTRGGFALQSDEVTTQLVEAARSLGIDCDLNAVACGVEVGQLADVQFVLLGRATVLPSLPANDDGDSPISAQAETIGLALTLVDVRQARAVTSLRAQIPRDADVQVSALDDVANAIYTPEGRRDLASLAVVPTPAESATGMVIEIDGIALPPGTFVVEDGLLPGQHRVAVHKKAFLSQHLGVDLIARGSVQLPITLVVDPSAEVEVVSATQIAIPFVAAGVGAVVAIGGGVMMGLGLQPYFAHQDANAAIEGLDQGDSGYPIDARRLHGDSATGAEDWNSYGQTLTVSGAVATGLGVVVAVGGLVWGTVLLAGDPGEATQVP